MKKLFLLFSAAMMVFAIGMPRSADAASFTGAQPLTRLQSAVDSNVVKAHTYCRTFRVCTYRKRYCKYGHVGWYWRNGYKRYGWHCVRWGKKCVRWRYVRRCYNRNYY